MKPCSRNGCPNDANWHVYHKIGEFLYSIPVCSLHKDTLEMKARNVSEELR